MDGALAYVDQKARWITPEGGRPSREHLGPEGIATLIEERRDGPAHHLLHTTLHADGDHVFAEYTRSPSADPRAQGSEHNLAVFELARGKVLEVREFTLRHSGRAGGGRTSAA